MNASYDTTSWSTIADIQAHNSAVCRAALSRLCAAYWVPLYCYVRRRGYGVDEARDLTQEFFCRTLERGTMGLASQQRGRFRHFLTASMDHFLADEWRRRSSLKRGGDTSIIPLDFEMAESRYCWDGHADADPRTVYDRQWAQALLDAATARLEQEYAASGRAKLFEYLKDGLVGREESGTYRAVGEALSMTPGAVKAAAYRMRKRYAVCLREEIAATLRDVSALEDELRYLLAAASR